MEQQLTQPLCIISGPDDRRAGCARTLGAAGFEVLVPEGHGLPSHPDPITAHAAGAPNSGHTPGTPHPSELHFVVRKGDHGPDHPGCPGKGCDHIGQTEPRPTPLEDFVGQPYEDDPSISFLAVVTDHPDEAAGYARRAGWQLRATISPTLQTVESDRTDEERITAIERELAFLKGTR